MPKSMGLHTFGSILLVALLAYALSHVARTAFADDQAKSRTPLQIECSRQADAKNLHGQARFDFRKDCLSRKEDAPAVKTEAPAHLCRKYSIAAGGMIDAPCD
jgi:hypothetical protein